MASFSFYNSINPADFGIPLPVRKEFTYVGSGASDDDSILTITYLGPPDTRSGVTTYPTLGVLTFAYIGSTNNILSITRTS